MPSNPALIVVVDDDASVRQSLARVLAGQGYRVRTYRCAADYLADGGALSPACVLADVCMPEVDGLEMLRASIAAGLPVPTVFMTDLGDVATVVSAMREGAVDVLEKPFEVDSLLQAVSAAVERAESSRVSQQELVDVRAALGRLTPREAEVAALVATGRLNKQIAAILGTSEKTVKVHRGRAMRKLNADSVVALVRLLDRALASPHNGDARIARADAGQLGIIARTLATSAAA